MGGAGGGVRVQKDLKKTRWVELVVGAQPQGDSVGGAGGYGLQEELETMWMELGIGFNMGGAWGAERAAGE